jgi:hypothetical protein
MKIAVGTAHLTVVNIPENGSNEGVIRRKVGKMMLAYTPEALKFLFTNRFRPNLIGRWPLGRPTLGKSKYPGKGSDKGAIGKKVRKITFFDTPPSSKIFFY